MIVAGESVIVANELPDSERFECEQPEESEEADDEVESRFNFDRFEPDDDDYESAVVCETRNKTIYPKGLKLDSNNLSQFINLYFCRSEQCQKRMEKSCEQK